MNKLFCSKELSRFVLLIALIFSTNVLANSATFTVTKTADTNDGFCDADCSLREAIGASNTLPSNDAVEFTPTLFNTAQTIVLGGTELRIENNGSLSINGTGTNSLTISGNYQSRVFFINPGVDVVFNNLTISNGSTGLGDGGGILKDGGTNGSLLSTLTINNCNIINNSAGSFTGTQIFGGEGGGIAGTNSPGSIIINNSSINNNYGTSGGGIAGGANNITIVNSTISGNLALLGAGGISTSRTSNILNSSIYKNESKYSNAGGISNSGTMTVINSTISENSAGEDGGGIYNSNNGQITLTNSTISSNRAGSDGGGDGGGIRNSNFNGNSINIRNTIIADNLYGTSNGSPNDVRGYLVSQGFNLIETLSNATIFGDTTSNITGQDPQLLPLGNYGGLTQTQALRPTSPAIDAGSAVSSVTTDQRGFLRPFDFPSVINAIGGNGSDIGAFERQSTDVSRMTLFDYDGDGKSDISVYRPESGVWHLQQSQSNYVAIGFGLLTDKLVPADYNGDGKTDIAVFRENPSDSGKANFYILQSSNNQFREEQFGASGDIPVSGDWDGDGKADIGVYRAGTTANSQGYFYYRPSSQPTVNFIPYPWGIAGDKPVVADYDGDGKADPAVFRPSNGAWYVQRSRDGFYAIQFGASEDKPVVGDYDGDGKADQAVFRPSNGVWYIWRSKDNSFSAAQFGVSADKPAPADYDGDGKTDMAVYRDGSWFLLNSTSGFAALGFGLPTDKPVPHSFTP